MCSEEVESRMGWTRGGVPTRTLDLEGGGLGFHIDGRRERVPTRTLGPEGGSIVRSHVGWGGERNIQIRVWKPLPSRRVLKTLKGTLRGKAQSGHYLLAVGLGCYKWYRARHGAMCSEEVESRRGVDTRRCANKDAGP